MAGCCDGSKLRKASGDLGVAVGGGVLVAHGISNPVSPTSTKPQVKGTFDTRIEAQNPRR